MIYVNKNYNNPAEDKEFKEVDAIFYHDKDNIQRKISSVYRGGKLLWELIVGFLQTKNGDMLQCKGNVIIKCKNQ